MHPESYPRGEQHYAAKHSNETIALIRALYATGEFTQTALAVRFNTKQGYISNVILGRVRRYTSAR